MVIVTMDFMVNASNIYRTKDYIVKQEIHIGTDGYDTNQVVSVDTYYKRTPEREVAYKAMFKDRKRINGKRLPSTMFTRTYVE